MTELKYKYLKIQMFETLGRLQNNQKKKDV